MSEESIMSGNTMKGLRHASNNNQNKYRYSHDICKSHLKAYMKNIVE